MLNVGRKLLGDFTTISDTLRESAALERLSLFASENPLKHWSCLSWVQK